MRTIFSCVVFVLLLSCTPDGPVDPSQAELVEKANAYIRSCEESGGTIDTVADLNVTECYPPKTEGERKRNLESYRFRDECRTAGGVVNISSNGAVGCIPPRQIPSQMCTTSADCSGTCIYDETSVTGGYCAPARPLLGCFQEAGKPETNKICAE
jgi:hypothetical protein